uniref:Uncharacterized protein n=1 Tax=Rhizophora mucronata TaxID=61149 RepID=A0A2P2NAY1_RHIMU
MHPLISSAMVPEHHTHNVLKAINRGFWT